MVLEVEPIQRESLSTITRSLVEVEKSGSFYTPVKQEESSQWKGGRLIFMGSTG